MLSGRSILLTLLLVTLAVVSFGQTPKPTPPARIDDDIIKVSSRLVVIPVSVTDAGGGPVTDLTIKDFKVLEDGRTQNLDLVGNADVVPLEIALLFDVSASTDAMFKFEQETAAEFLRQVLKPIDRATIYTIGQRPIMVQSRDVAERSIASVMSISATKGATAFFDTVGEAARTLTKNSPEGTRKVVVVISDGEDNFSEGLQMKQRVEEAKISSGKPDPDYRKVGKVLALAQQQTKISERKKVLRQLNDADAVFYSINPGGSSYQLNQISLFGQENMQEFAASTGGSAFLPKFLPIDTKDAYRNEFNMRQNREKLTQIFRELISELRAQYLIQYYSETEFAPNRYIKLDVSVPTRTNVKVRARQGYYVKN